MRGGTATISANATDGSGISARMTITVIIPVESFYIIPASASVNVGRTTTLKVNGTPLNATYHNATDFTWESSDESIATISETGVITGVSEGTATITVTSHNGIERTCPVTVSVRTNAIDITVEGGGAAEVSEGASDLKLRATAVGPDGTPGSVAQDFNWSVSNSSYATLINHGDGTVTVTGRRAGTVKVTAVARDGSGVRGEITVRIIVPIKSCWMEPVTSASLFTGETLQLRVNGTPANATYHAPADFTWVSSDEKVATVSGTGLVTAVGYGEATITATSHNDLSVTCDIIVSVAVDSIEIIPIGVDEPTVEVAGEPLTLQATGYDMNGSSENIAQTFNWTSSNSSIATVAVGEDGTATVTGLKPGTVTITVTAKDGSGTRETIQVTVIAPVQDFTIPETQRVAIGETETLSLSIVPANTTFGERTDFTWESEDADIATVSETGVVTGVKLGTTTITVTSHNGIVKTCDVTVTNPTNKVVISSEAEGQSELATGEEMTLTATAYGKDGSTDEVAQDFTWMSSNAAIAKVEKGENGAATVTGLKAGTVTITATTTDGSNIRGTYTVKVIVAVEGFAIPANAQAIVGKSVTLTLTVEPTNATYKARTDFTWESSDEDVATVSTNGVITGVKAGTATITVTSHNGIEKTCEVTITEPAAKVEVEPASEGQTEVATGEEMTLTATAYGEDETTNNVAQGFTWKSSNAAIATVKASANGEAIVTGVKAGTVTITATASDGSGVSGTYTVKVIVAVEDFTIPETERVVIGETETLSLSVEPSDATYKARTDFTWESSDADVVIVDENGAVTAVDLGTATITVTSHNGIKKECEVTVTNPTNKVVIAPATAGQTEVATGDEMTLTATAYGKDGTITDVTQDFIWTTSSASIADVVKGENGNTATVTGLKAGTVTITATTTDGSNIRGTYTITVIVLVEDFTLPANTSVVYGENATLALTVEPSDATYDARTDFTWESSDADIVSVSESGVVTGVDLGTATITVTSHNGIVRKCEVTVTNPTDKVVVSPADPENDELVAGEKDLLLKAVAYGKDGTTDEVAQDFTWSSSDASIATVKKTQDGALATVTGLKAGTVTITATVNDGTNVKGTYAVTVVVPVTGLKLPESAELPIVQTLDLGKELAFEPEDATLRDVEWRSADDTIATVNENGVVTGRKAGKVLITVTAKSDPDVSASCEVHVKSIPTSIEIKAVGDYIPYGNAALLYIPYPSEYNVHYRNESVTLSFDPEDENVADEVEWQVYSGASRVAVTRNEDDTFTVTARSNGLSSSESRATVVVRARSKYDNNVIGSYTIVLARGISRIVMNDMQIDYDTTTSFRVPQPTIYPANATFRNSSDFVWMSSDPDVVSISEGGVCTVNGTGVAYISMCPKYDCGYLNGGSPDVNGGFSVTVLKKTKQVVIAMVNDEFDEIISINEGVAPHGGNVQLLAVALEDGYTWDDYLAGRLPAAGQRFDWSTSNANQASIKLDDPETGLCLFHCVRVTGNGYVTLRANTKDGSGAYGIFRLRIVSPITEIQNIPEELVLRVGEEYTFEPATVPADTEIDLFWHEIKERDRHIASMDGNTVTALSPGTVTLAIAPVDQQNTLNAPNNTVIELCEVTVVSDDPATMRINGAQDGQTFRIGDVVDLSATVLAADGSSEGVDQKVSWDFSFEDVWIPNEKTGVMEYHPNGEALVIDDETGELTAVGTGVATITATARSKTVDGETISRTITVYIQDEKITGIPEEIILTPGESYTFEPALEPASESASFTWDALSEADKAVVSMEGNTVTAVGPGSATLTLTADGVDGKATCTVRVADAPASITLTGLEEGQRIAMGDKIQLTATLLDENGSAENVPQEIVWDCSNWGIANVENGLVAPYSMGELTITAASAIDPDVKASVTVYVGMDRIEGIPAELTLYAGETYTFEPTISDSAAEFIWRALSEEEAKIVSIEGNALTALAEGSVRVTVESAEYKGLIASCEVTVLTQSVHSVKIEGAVDGQELTVGTQLQLTATPLAEDGTQNGLIDKGIQWSTNDTAIATISDEGLLEVLTAGELTITATSTADAEVKASLKFTCVEAPEEEGGEEEPEQEGSEDA